MKFIKFLFWLPFLGILAFDLYEIYSSDGEKSFSDVGYLLDTYLPDSIDVLTSIIQADLVVTFLSFPAWAVSFGLAFILSIFVNLITDKGHQHKNKVVASAWRQR